ncbi:MAG TPA: PQQ-binding-like beta-propeller repeat protein, partial [Gemmataceae bacterium]|nr:PQQ-binding-like beta-propeller repeat protein [Gemmataceae bacterium]
VLLCLDRRDGKVLWQRVVLTAPLEKKHKLNSYASSTPATDGKHVWVSFLAYPRMVVVCYDLDGNEVWRVSPGEFHSVHGFCSPPVLYKDLVILNGDQDAKAYIVALEKQTGKERWRADRPNRTRSYCPPLVIDAGGRKELVLSGSKCVASYDPDTGKQRWIIDGPTEQFVASLVYRHGLLCLTAGFPTYHLMGIRPGGEGNVTKTAVAWHHDYGKRPEVPYVPSPIAFGDYFAVVSDGGWATCVEIETGNRVWRGRLGGHHSASPVAAGGYLYFPADDGTTYVLRAGPKFEVVARNELDEAIRSSPAVAHGQLFLRTLEHLYCIGRSEKAQK